MKGVLSQWSVLTVTADLKIRTTREQMAKRRKPRGDDGESEDYWEQGADLIGTVQQLTDVEDAPPLPKKKRRPIGFCRDIDKLEEEED